MFTTAIVYELQNMFMSPTQVIKAIYAQWPTSN